MPRYLSRFFSRTKTKYDEILGITVAYDWSFHELGFEEPVVCCARIKLEEKVDTWKAAWFVLGGFEKYCKTSPNFQGKLYYNSVIKSEFKQ